MGLAEELRANAATIVSRWADEVVREVPVLASLSHADLVDELPQFLAGLAGWIDSEDDAARSGFSAHAEGHAAQRHNLGIEIDVVVAEYAVLRRLILDVVRRAADPADHTQLIRLEAGIDHAILHAARRYAAARDVVRERFIGILAHDLRDPLTAVMMSATLLSDMALGDKQAQLVDRLARGARRIERMIDDLLDFARGRLSGGIPVFPDAGDIGELCREAVEEAKQFPPPRDVELDLQGDLRGMFDRERVRQALANLLANARHYGQGTITVRAWERDDRGAVLTSVTNRGSLISPQALAHIFDPFTRGEPARQAPRGLGLGLYIVDQIARAHGGNCRAESAGDTTTFTIEWPRKSN